jgi:hypothetical protein
MSENEFTLQERNYQKSIINRLGTGSDPSVAALGSPNRISLKLDRQQQVVSPVKIGGTRVYES